MEQLRQPHILFVDDDNDLRATFAASMQARGLVVTERTNGEEAVNWLETNRPDALVTGILMPRISGFELIERLRVDPKRRDIPVFVFSHRGRPEDRERAKKLGVRDFFVYGFISPGEVAATLLRFLGEGMSTPAGGSPGVLQ